MMDQLHSDYAELEHDQVLENVSDESCPSKNFHELSSVVANLMNETKRVVYFIYNKTNKCYMTKWNKGNPIWSQENSNSIEHAVIFTKPLARLMDDVDRLMSCLGTCQEKELEIRPAYVVINNF